MKFISEGYLKNHTIFPNTSLEGYILIPFHRKVTDIDLVVKIGDKEFKVDIRVVTLHAKQGKRVSRVSFCKETTPHVLKRTTTYYDKKSATLYTTTSAVTEFDVKQDVLGDEKTVCRIVTTHKQNGTTTITDELYCADIPGGIISQKIIDKNADDHITRRTTLELTNYAIGEQESRLPIKEPYDK